MMMGVAALLRTRRHSSTPLIPGIIKSVTIRSGLHSSNRRKRFFRIVGCSHVVPLGGKGGAQHARDLGLIVYYQDSFCHLHPFTI